MEVGAAKTFVLVHGAWHGGWCWRRVAERLRGQGHVVFTPTCTGLGERAHLMSRSITIETFIRDVVGVIEAEELSDIVLVGHSFAGNVVSGVADRLPQRLRHLVYLDALVVAGGRMPIDGIPAEAAAARHRLAEESGGVSLPPPDPAFFGVVDGDDAAWVKRRLTPHPFGTWTSHLRIEGPVGNGLPRTYIACTQPIFPALEASRQWVKRQAGWNWREIATGHDAMVSMPEELSRMLVELAA